MKLGGALQGVVELCCKVANMEGLEMNTLLKRTYETYGHLSHFHPAVLVACCLKVLLLLLGWGVA